MAIAIFFTLIKSRAALVSSNLLSTVTLNNATNTGAAVQLGTVSLPQITFLIQSTGTGGTNSSGGGTVYSGLSTNFSQMVAVGTYRATNDTVYSFTITNSSAIPIYFAFQGFNSTNQPMQISAQAVQNK